MLPSQQQVASASILSKYPAAIQAQAGVLTRRMLFFGFPAILTRFVEGPIVNTFYFKVAGDAKFSAILSKDEELAGTLGVEAVRIERILGEVAIAVPRADRQTIYFDRCLHDMLISPTTSEMQLPLLMGQNQAGDYLYADLASQPHLLIAGATGSGKSIFTAQLICSLSLFRTPEDLEFILVDTKNLDLVLFKELEHTHFVLSQLEDIRVVIKDLLREIRFRNQQMSGIARNIKEWNALNNGLSKVMKYKVLIIDEMADIFDSDDAVLRQYKRSERPDAIQDLIKQAAQISRASGIHIIAATQRPSVEVLSGDIKTNFPARVSFKLPSKTDSRVILDENGAESLLGLGDYLYKIAGSDIVKRAHSAFVSMNDIATIITQNEQIRRQYAQFASR